MTENIYQAPQSNILDTQDAINYELASLGQRFGASILDSIITMVIVLPLGFLLGYYQALFAGQNLSLSQNVFLAGISLVAFFIVHGYLLSTRGQTVGKKVLGIKIVDMNGELLPFTKLIGFRYVPQWVVSYIPFVGSVLYLIEILFIFRADRRCVHDLIAGTQVVKI